MAFSIRNPEAEAIAREIVSITGLSLTSVVADALRVRLAQLKTKTAEDQDKLFKDLKEIAHRCAQLPTLSNATKDEVLGYDSWGIPENPSSAYRGN